MNYSTGQWLTRQEEQKIAAAVASAEKHTSGEIVCRIAPGSYDYPRADIIGATAMALPLSLALTPLLGAWLWMGAVNMWLFLGSFAILFLAGHVAVRRLPRLKRLFISQREMDEEVAEAAMTAFYRMGVSRTRERTGVLLYISLLERKVWVLADQGINAKVAPGHWDAVVSRLTEELHRHPDADAVCRAIAGIGVDLERHFPRRPDDTDELRNVIITDQ